MEILLLILIITIKKRVIINIVVIIIMNKIKIYLNIIKIISFYCYYKKRVRNNQGKSLSTMGRKRWQVI